MSTLRCMALGLFLLTASGCAVGADDVDDVTNDAAQYDGNDIEMQADSQENAAVPVADETRRQDGLSGLTATDKDDGDDDNPDPTPWYHVENPDPTPWEGEDAEDPERHQEENPDPTPWTAAASEAREPDPQPWTD